jgi:hypothetical protein
MALDADNAPLGAAAERTPAVMLNFKRPLPDWTT